jgi:hypothetical protein
MATWTQELEREQRKGRRRKGKGERGKEGAEAWQPQETGSSSRGWKT